MAVSRPHSPSKAFARRRDRPGDVLRAAARDAREGASVRGADDIEDAPVRRLDVGAADDIGVKGERRAGELA